MPKKKRSLLKSAFVWMLAVATTMSMTMPSKGWAMLAPADGAVAAGDSTRAQDAQAVQTALETEMIRERLADFNVTPEQVNERLAQMSNEEVHQVAQQIDGNGLPAVIERLENDPAFAAPSQEAFVEFIQTLQNDELEAHMTELRFDQAKQALEDARKSLDEQIKGANAGVSGGLSGVFVDDGFHQEGDRYVKSSLQTATIAGVLTYFGS